MLRAACGQLLELLGTGGWAGRSINSFNEGSSAFVDNGSKNSCERERAGMFPLTSLAELLWVYRQKRPPTAGWVAPCAAAAGLGGRMPCPSGSAPVPVLREAAVHPAG